MNNPITRLRGSAAQVAEDRCCGVCPRLPPVNERKSDLHDQADCEPVTMGGCD